MTQPTSVNIKPALVMLLQQIGLYAQANNLSCEQETKSFDSVMVVNTLKKHQISYSVNEISTAELSHTIHPFLLLPTDSAPIVARRSGERYEHLTLSANQPQWQALAPESLTITGHVITIDALPSAKSGAHAFAAHMSKRTKWYKPVFWLSLLSSLTGLAVPLFTMAVYDRVIGGQAPEVLPSLALGAILAVTILISSRLARASILSSTSNRFARDLSNITFRRLLSMPLIVLSRVGLTNHLARIRNAEKVRTLLSGPSGAGLIDLPFTSIALVTIALLSGWLVLVPLVMLLLFYLVMKAVKKYTQAATPTISSEYQNASNDLAKQLLQLKISGDTQGWNTKFSRLCKEHCRQNFLYSKRNGLTGAIAHAMSLITALVTVFTGIFLVLNQSISPGALIACVMLIWRITGPAQLAFSSSQKITMMDSAIKQFDRFMEAGTEHNELRLDVPDTTQAPEVSFKHLTLRYSADVEPALSGISFDVAPGEIVAIIGPNGCGKTSLLQTAIGILDAQAGYISVNGKNLKQYDPQSFRQWAGFNSAQPDLFPGSLADNLRIAKPDATDEELFQALDNAGASTLFASLNNDLNVDLFAQGHSILSDIEGSYICLARALLKSSTYLVLDEPIANQNPYARHAFINMLNRIRGKATILFTTHDQALIQQADKVVILDKGAVVYAGPLPDQAETSPSKATMQESNANG
ncbi:ATP-binding cassette domain-containing protein [Shewanella colwelliana]|uniref:peptidase domain-containing ABC transporter n=1 Tax=Shewanella colwelliana TaxID=23 RepID=UPI00299F1812|nr:ATP-binding cassette domain-containing protein [Shewanella colwelliana]MDX1282269.1 ATP-binding cassette domain-containing protein [Shewanella colwelliana]